MNLRHNEPSSVCHTGNPNYQRFLTGDALLGLQPEDTQAATAEISSWPGYAPTPLVSLPGLAKHADVAAVLYKDEAHRFGLGSFKALGGAYAVLSLLKLVLAKQGIEASATDLLNGGYSAITSKQTMVCATDGNHGKSVAWGAQMFGCACRIYIHEHVSKDREAAIAAYGATMVRVPGNYDDSINACARDATDNGWTLVADTNAGGGSAFVPQLVMHGYSIIVQEMLDQLSSSPTHVFIPAGVGGLAAAVAGYWAITATQDVPRMVVVEPHVANCVFAAIRDGEVKPVAGDLNSFMACLSAGQVSPAALPVLRQAVSDVVTIPDQAAISTMKAMANGQYGDPPLVSGESGCASVAAILQLANQSELRKALGIDANSRIIAIGSEGATAPEVWAEVVGRLPETVNS